MIKEQCVGIVYRLDCENKEWNVELNEKKFVLFAENYSEELRKYTSCAKAIILKSNEGLVENDVFISKNYIPIFVNNDAYNSFNDGMNVIVMEDGKVLVDKRDSSIIPNEIRKKINEFVVEYDKKHKILAVGVQGGYGRGTAINSSDIDLIFLFKKDSDSIGYPKGQVIKDGLEFEVRHMSIEKLDIKKLSPKVKYIYSNELIVFYEKNYELSEIVTKSRLSRFDRIKEVVFGIRKMESLGIVCNEGTIGLLKGFMCSNNPNYWVDRNDLMSAHMWLFKATERVLGVIFAINGLYLPSNKWRYNILMNLEWKPNNLKEKLIESNCISDFTKESFEIRKKAYSELLSDCVKEADNRGLLPDDFFEFYNKHLKSYGDNTE